MHVDSPPTAISDPSDHPLDLKNTFKHPAGLPTARYLVGRFLQEAQRSANLTSAILGCSGHFANPTPLSELNPEISSALVEVLEFRDVETQSSDDEHIEGRAMGYREGNVDIPLQQNPASLANEGENKVSHVPSPALVSPIAHAEDFACKSSKFAHSPPPSETSHQGYTLNKFDYPFQVDYSSRFLPTTPINQSTSFPGEFQFPPSSLNNVKLNQFDLSGSASSIDTSSGIKSHFNVRRSLQAGPSSCNVENFHLLHSDSFTPSTFGPSPSITNTLAVPVPAKDLVSSSTTATLSQMHITPNGKAPPGQSTCSYSPFNVNSEVKVNFAPTIAHTFPTSNESAFSVTMVSQNKNSSKKRKSPSEGKQTLKKQKTERPIKPKRAPKPKAKKVPAIKAKYKLGLDIWMRILEFTPPRFLRKVRCLNSEFKDLVDKFQSIYVNCRKENFGYDMPSPPEGLNERQYSDLLGGKGCMEPGCSDKHAYRTHWSWSKRWCWQCWKNKVEREDRILKVRQHEYSRATLLKMLECIPVGMHDSYLKPHDYVDDALPRPSDAPRLYKIHLVEDVQKIIAEYENLTPVLRENENDTPEEKAAAQAKYAEELAALEDKRTEFFAVRKAKNDDHMAKVQKIEQGIRNRRDTNRDPHTRNREARKALFTKRAGEDLPDIPAGFVVTTKAFKAATRVFRDPGTERGWKTLKPKIQKEWEEHQREIGVRPVIGDRVMEDANEGSVCGNESVGRRYGNRWNFDDDSEEGDDAGDQGNIGGRGSNREIRGTSHSVNNLVTLQSIGPPSRSMVASLQMSAISQGSRNSTLSSLSSPIRRSTSSGDGLSNTSVPTSSFLSHRHTLSGNSMSSIPLPNARSRTSTLGLSYIPPMIPPMSIPGDASSRQITIDSLLRPQTPARSTYHPFNYN